MSCILVNMVMFHFVFLFHIFSVPEKMNKVFIYRFCEFSLEGL